MYKITRDLQEDELLAPSNNSYHLRNQEGQNFRTGLAQTLNRSSKLSYSAELIELHHGTMRYRGEIFPATLIVFEFLFLSKQQSRRYKSVEIDLAFHDEQRNPRKDPEIVKISPEKVFYLNKTTHHSTTTYGAAATVKVGVEGLASADTGVSWEIAEEKSKVYKATLTGERRCGDCPVDLDRRTSLQWSMSENPGARDGIPTFLRTAVLLRRFGDEPFTCFLNMRSEVDRGSKILRVSDRLTDIDKVIDPIILDPKQTHPMQNNRITAIRAEDLDHMERLMGRVESYCRVSFSESEEDSIVLAGDYSPRFPPPPDRDTGLSEGGDEVSSLTTPLSSDDMAVKSFVPETSHPKSSKSSGKRSREPGTQHTAKRKELDMSVFSMMMAVVGEATAATKAAARSAAKATEAANEAAEAAARAAKAASFAEAAIRTLAQSLGQPSSETASSLLIQKSFNVERTERS